MTPEEALCLWDDHQSQRYPAGWATFDVNGQWLVEITDAAAGHLSTIWGRSALRRSRPRLDAARRAALVGLLPDLEAAIEATDGDGRAFVTQLRDIVRWAIDDAPEVVKSES
jgi:hypothetical protein